MGGLQKGTVPVVERDPFISKIAQSAAKGQLLGGGRGARLGVRDALLERYTPAEAEVLAEQIMKATPGDIRGGIALRVPFVKRNDKGLVTNRVANLTPGAGIMTDALGMTAMADAARDVFNGYRSTNFFKSWSKLMNGRFGEEYANVIRQEHRGEGGLSYETFRNLVRADEGMKARVRLLDEPSRNVIIAANLMLKKAASKPEAEEAAVKYAMMGDNMVWDATKSESDRAGFEAAKVLREQGNALADEYFAAVARTGGKGSRFTGDLASWWIARPLTKMERDLRARRNEPTDAYDPSEMRILGEALGGEGQMRLMSNDVLNAEAVRLGLRPAGHAMFETDPFSIAAQQYAAYIKGIGRMHLIADMKDLGVLTQATPGKVRTLNIENIKARRDMSGNVHAMLARKLGEAMKEASDAGDMARVKLIDQAIDKVAANGETIKALLSNINDMDPEHLKVIGNLMRVLRNSLAEGEKFGVTVKTGTRKRLLNRKTLTVKRSDYATADQLVAEGKYAVGGNNRTVRLPESMTNMYADEAVKDAVERYFKVETGAAHSSIRKFYEGVYKPWYTVFRTYATIGRPGGYHVRNQIGASWNNWLGDVTVQDHTLAAKALLMVHRADAKAQEALGRALKGEAHGLPQELDGYVQDALRAAQGRSTGVYDDITPYLAQRIADYDMAKFKVGDYTLADVYHGAVGQGIIRKDRLMDELAQSASDDPYILADALANPGKRNVFQSKARSELTGLERGVNASVNFAPVRMSGTAAEQQENFVRLAAFVSGAKRFGMDDGGEAAGYFSKALQFDYQDLSDFERDVLKNIIPFYTWTRRNVPLQFYSLFYQPGKFNTLDYVQGEAQNAFGAKGDDGGMANLVPSWMQDKMGFVSDLNPFGSSDPMVIGLETPAADLNRYLGFGNLGDVMGKIGNQVLGATNPLIKTTMETATNTDTFTGNQFPKQGEPTAFGLPVPFLGYQGPDGSQRIDSRWGNIGKDLLPPVGVLQKVLGLGSNSDRYATNMASTFLGAPVSTLTPQQSMAEMYSRTDTLETAIARAAGSLGVSSEWLLEQVKGGASAESIRNSIAMGYGRLAPQ
jgi:hypothetical protein